MLIREMVESDIDEVCQIERETFSDPWNYEDFLNSYQNENNQYLIAEVDGRIAGYCGYWGIAGEGDIYNVAVKKEFRRQKIGIKMLNVLISQAKSRGITALTLEVRQSNEAARKLYQQLGFVDAGIRKDFYTLPKEDAVIMWLNPIQ
jgi:ribosomal-protein-alanine N-acetyltransferase